MHRKHKQHGPMGHEQEWLSDSGSNFGAGPQAEGRGRRRGHRRGGGRRKGRRPRVSRGEVRIAVLALLETEPMHGYQIMQELEEKSGGVWQPSPGSIYPTLQQLADEGLIRSEPRDGKNVFHLTEDGASAVRDDDTPPPWERFGGEGAAGFVNLRRGVFQVGAAARQIGATGTQAQAEAAYEILNETRKQLYGLLAADDEELEGDG